ncbi:MAG: 2-phospho-L-lactate transferase [Solirubrobacterales bacterium]|nr:2-phospho-L-lactate transferase [Solirubrobacterales bacterium]
MRVALLSGGTGGAKLARGLLDAVGGDTLTVVANTGDDVHAHGAHVSPDPDLVAYWLADAIDARGYGIAGDSWRVMDALEAAGRPTWFRLGDRDLAMCLIRGEELAGGASLTAAHGAVCAALGLTARVLPMSDSPAPTAIATGGREQPFQEFMILGGGRGPLDGVGLAGAPPAPGPLASAATLADRSAPHAPAPTAAVLEAIAAAEAIVIGPSNPIASIGPILALPGLCDALSAAAAPVVAVSPFVGGRVLKGPTELFCRFAGIAPDSAGVAGFYGDLVDGIVADEEVPGTACRVVPTLMDTPAARAAVAEAVVGFARELA